MPDDGSQQSKTIWPLVKFSFQVKWDKDEMVFQEVTGLSSETKTIKYRGGNSKVYSEVKLPGLKEFGNVTLKKGIFKGDTAFWDKYNEIKMNTVKRSSITISLLDESNAPVMNWTLTNAFPCKISVTDMKADANEVAIETMELAHEGLQISK